jgi:hypothetical protein
MYAQHTINLQMSKARILIRLLRMYFPRNSKFGLALLKLRNYKGGGIEHPNPLLPLVHHCSFQWVNKVTSDTTNR